MVRLLFVLMYLLNPNQSNSRIVILPLTVSVIMLPMHYVLQIAHIHQAIALVRHCCYFSKNVLRYWSQVDNEALPSNIDETIIVQKDQQVNPNQLREVRPNQMSRSTA